MRRIVIVGGRGFFGAALAERLRADGISPLIASRRPGSDIQVDVEEFQSIQRALRPNDVVVDTTGPFQSRSTTLVKAAIETRFDLIDISDSLAYATQIESLRPQIEAAGIRVLTACSVTSTISAAVLTLSSIAQPRELNLLLMPASRYTANRGTVGSMISSVGQKIHVFCDGRLQEQTGWRHSREFLMPPPIHRLRGYLIESVDAVTLPSVWPSLRAVRFYVGNRSPMLNLLLNLASRIRLARNMWSRFQSIGIALARQFGSDTGCVSYEVRDSTNNCFRCALVSPPRTYHTAIAPAALAAQLIARDGYARRGLIPANMHVDVDKLFEYLRMLGTEIVKLE